MQEAQPAPATDTDSDAGSECVSKASAHRVPAQHSEAEDSVMQARHHTLTLSSVCHCGRHAARLASSWVSPFGMQFLRCRRCEAQKGLPGELVGHMLAALGH